MKRFFFILLLCLLFSPVPESRAATPQPRKVIVAGRAYFYLRELFRGCGVRMDSSGSALSLSSPHFSCRLFCGKRKMLFNGIKLDLNFSPAARGKEFLISAVDWNKTLRPLLYPAVLQKRPVKIITIDMGHGGRDPGAIGRISREKNITLPIGLRLASMLRAAGFQVRMTRTTDRQIPLTQVDVLQRAHKSDLFVSIHVNAARDTSLCGVETYTLTPAGVPSSNSGRSKVASCPGNRFDLNNIALACQVQKALLRRTGAADHGVKHARYMVLRDLNAPGVLVEVGFLSNRAEEKKLNDPAYREKIARGIADGIIQYHKLMQ